MSDEETEAVAAEDVDEPQDDDEQSATDTSEESESDETEVAETEVAETETEADEASDAGDDGDDGDDGAADGLQDGDFIELSYTAYTVEDDQLVDTTSQEVAEEEGVGDQGTFEPRTIILGAGHLFEAVEDAIVGHDVGHSDTVVVPAAEAFGEYDQEKVRTVSADKIDEDDRYPGAQIQIDGEQGYLETIIGGRARVDFNHPLAGDDIEYEFEVLDVVEDRLEQARGLMNMFLDMDLEMHIETDEVEEERPVESDEDEDEDTAADDDEESEDDEAAADEGEGEDEDEDEDEDEEPEPEFETVTVEKETLYIEATPQLSFNQQWLFQKQQIAQEIIDRVGLDRIVIEEVIDGSGGMPGMMGGMGGMMGGAGGGAEGGDIEAALEDADLDEEELLEELDADIDEE